MPKKIAVISTYPKQGSKNIGDQLITRAVVDLLKKHHQDAVIETFWRAADWDDVKKGIEESDIIVFACLIIREKMNVIEYPYIGNILDLNKPISIVSAGTSLHVHRLGQDIYNYLSQDSIELLKKLDNVAISFSTRGYLTQSLCKRIGLNNVTFGGDVAFCETKCYGKSFEKRKKIKDIVISDPHHEEFYLKSFLTLIEEVKISFPDSNIKIALHGVNRLIENFARENDIPYIRIYEDPEAGLRVYDQVDMHIGFRVHAHVSALARRKYSYLLEQDGRGGEYGLTIDKRISTPNFRTMSMNPLRRILHKIRLVNNITVDTIPAQALVAMIKQDEAQGFEKFIGLEHKLDEFSDNINNQIKTLI
ncbi:polysaccharide pyruvyl transferase family protein [Aliivibrio finisterrensis]|uniref:Polysaccharide pyruvyl transferase family protein n=1 Tax=Aliivibrio finisterrensis TaxID=511998 RepID=A0A6N6RNY9_9GAMM|nr:polysaccharide pyruvyl transferase family protein [Aliivibrio finisterrensis]KAB2823160.1 polysaccharide pyruvyl transferase family protein [Aliivibrio finisterrensis]